MVEINLSRNKYNFNNLEVSYNQYFIRLFKAFQKEFGKPTSVLYPCCFLDVSPSRVFRDVTYVDRAEKSIELMRKSGLTALCQDIKDYTPSKPHDLLVLIRPALSDVEQATKHIISGGYILAEGEYGCDLQEKPKVYNLEGHTHMCNRYTRNEKAIVVKDTQKGFISYSEFTIFRKR